MAVAQSVYEEIGNGKSEHRKCERYFQLLKRMSSPRSIVTFEMHLAKRLMYIYY